jgi:sortase A
MVALLFVALVLIAILAVVNGLAPGFTVAVGLPTPTTARPAAPTYTPRPTLTPTPAPGTPTAEPTATPSSTPTATPTIPPTVAPTVTPSATAAPTALPAGTPAPPAPLGRLIIPKLKVDTTILPVPILDGDWDMKRIVMEAGWLAGTSPVGGQGNTGLAGHVSLKCCGDGPFRWLEKLARGDEVIVQTDAVIYRYHVVELRVVDPTDVAVMLPTVDPQLTLVTCNDWDYSKSEYVKRLVVIAR